jgi:hypothetical protein
MFSIEKSYRRVVDNLIILLALKFDSHKPDRLGVMLFISPETESAQILYRFQKLHCLLKLMLQSVRGRYKEVVDAFLIFLVLQFRSYEFYKLLAVFYPLSKQISKTVMFDLIKPGITSW